MRSWHYIIKYAAIALAILLIIGVFSILMHVLSYFIPFFSSNTTGEMKTYEVGSDITVLDIDIHQVDLEVMTALDSNFKVESNYNYLSVLEKDNELHIQDKRGFHFNIRGNAVLKLYVPYGKVLEKADINTGTGTTDLENLQTKVIKLELGAGKAVLEKISVVDHAFVDAGAGKVVIKDSQFKNLDLDMGVGNFEFSGLLLGKNVLKQGVGSSQIDLVGSLDDYTIHVEKGLGSVRVGKENVKDNTQLGQGDRVISCKGGVGSVKIDFTE